MWTTYHAKEKETNKLFNKLYQEYEELSIIENISCCSKIWFKTKWLLVLAYLAKVGEFGLNFLLSIHKGIFDMIFSELKIMPFYVFIRWEKKYDYIVSEDILREYERKSFILKSNLQIKEENEKIKIHNNQISQLK